MSESFALSAASLPRIAGRAIDGVAVELPRYERKLDKRICHIGIGRFHRAHQAHYLHKLLQQGDAAGWGLCGIGLRAPDREVQAQLAAQDGLYSLWEMDGAQRRAHVIGSLMQEVDASADSAQAIAVMADPATRIISLTVTEKGYCLGADGELDASHADIVHDLAGPAHYRSAPGLIAAALAARRKAGHGGVTLMSCDNLIENGHALKRSVLDYARRADAALAQWIEANASFPCSMVDRITPVDNPPLRAAFCCDWGVQDVALVQCEPWLQWIIEDHFVAGRPAFEKAGAVISDRVPRYEDMKVGMLNGGHSALSHLGLLEGHSLVHKALDDATIRGWLSTYMREVAGTLEPLPGIDYADYEASLIRRFRNPAIEDRLTRLAQDTSSKYVQALLPPLLRRLQLGMPVNGIAMAIALWIAYLDRLCKNDAMRAEYLDARKDELIALAAAAVAGADAGAFLAAAIPLAGAQAEAFRSAVNAQLRGIAAKGAAAQVRTLL